MSAGMEDNSVKNISDTEAGAIDNAPEVKENFIKKHRLDIIVISAILIASIAFLLITTLARQEGAYVEITLNGSVVGKYPLAKDAVYTLGDGTNKLTVENGAAYMSYSECPDHTCENTGKIKYVGQTIVCLPNYLTVTVVGESDNSVDFVS